MNVILLIIILLIILLLLLIINKTNFDNNYKFYNGDNWDQYRIADVLYYNQYFTKNHNYSLIHHIYKFPDTIATKYLYTVYPFLKKYNKNNINTYKNSQDENTIINDINYDLKWDILLDIINKYDNNISLNNNELIIHIRVGDVLCRVGYHQADYPKKNNTEWWNNVIEYIKDNNINKIYIISGSHFNECIKESIEYIKDRIEFLKKSVDNVILLNKNPDETIIFCNKAKHFITTGGGYGRLIGNLVKKNGGSFILDTGTGSR